MTELKVLEEVLVNMNLEEVEALLTDAKIEGENKEVIDLIEKYYDAYLFLKESYEEEFNIK